MPNSLRRRQGGEKAVAGYQAVIEAHLANEAVFDSALRQLARYYMESGRPEEGIRFFMGLGQKMYGAKKVDTLRDIMNQFRRKYPEQVIYLGME
jgi:lipopolysaccharide biosynthesis regulator YciM